jgi:predicted membrane protein
MHYGQLGDILMSNGLILMAAIPVFSLLLIEPTDHIKQFSKQFLLSRQSGTAALPLWQFEYRRNGKIRRIRGYEM